MRKFDVQTRDGLCPVYVHTPQGEGPWPAVIVYFDAYGIRPATQEIAERLASDGYYVALPDLYYRAGPYGPFDPKTMRADPALREELKEKYQSTSGPANVMSDTAALLDFLAAQPEVKPGPVGVTGYCMGGNRAMYAVGTFPDRIAAAASYHGGGLATDKPNSPHLLAPKIKAKVYVAGATDDGNFPEEQKVRLEQALTDAGVDHVVETYPAKHGWVLRDNPVHDPVETEHHWRTLLALLDGVFKK
jgi:carboxymethylenebutenolidase